MSGVRSWFGSGAAKKKEEIPKNAILGLRTQLELLRTRERHLMNQMEEQDVIARQNASTNKKVAKAALRRKKAHEHSLEQTIAQIGTFELFASRGHSAVGTPSKKGPAAPTKKPLRHNTARHPDSGGIGLREFVRNLLAT
ncbi:hypothetical protein CHU98_g4821 [Xylaria longipes]|nr:hypothetical protein CHU98_g4821 [Xylaria longipes]